MRLGKKRSAGLVALVAGLALLGSACAYEVELAAPPPDAETTKLFAADGSLVTTLHAEQDREEVALGEIAPALRDAVIAIEDARFFSHKGVDLRAVVRALTRDAAAGSVKQGGSTITQQYVKNVLLDPEQTVNRKLKEAMLSFHLERRLTKETILERYLNRIYFGDGAYGVQAAAQTYFSKSAKDLSLAEGALLAGLIHAPERYDPWGAPEAAQRRRDVVLGRMEELGRAEPAAVEAAKTAPLGVVPRATEGRPYPAAYFVERVKRFILNDERFGASKADRRRLLFEEGLRIHTTLDLRLQEQAEAAVAGVLANPDADPSGAVVVLDPANGFVRALVGGRDFFGTAKEAKFDLATQGMRQSGSSFKPIVLAAALQAGTDPGKVYNGPGSLNVPMPDGQPDWVVENYEGEGTGPMTLADATVHSVNTVYAQLIGEVGAQKAVDLARDLGVRSPLRPFPSAVLGTNEVTVLDMASAYSTFAADGMHSDPVFVTEIARADGSVLYRKPSTRKRVLPTDVARKVNGVLSEVITRGTAQRAQIGRPAAGKTGTAQQWRDAWFVGYTPDLVTAVWVGFPERQKSMLPPATPAKITGGSWPAEIWKRVMEPALAGKPVVSFPAPPAAAPPTLPPPPAPVAVIDVAGLSEADARAALAAVGLTVGLVERRPDKTQPAGNVVEQAPAAGALAPSGSTVTLVLSSGPPRTIAVPSLTGLAADEAARLISEAGLVPDLVVGDPPAGVSARPGRVWKQSVPAGTPLDERATVTVWAKR